MDVPVRSKDVFWEEQEKTDYFGVETSVASKEASRDVASFHGPVGEAVREHSTRASTCGTLARELSRKPPRKLLLRSLPLFKVGNAFTEDSWTFPLRLPHSSREHALSAIFHGRFKASFHGGDGSVNVCTEFPTLPLKLPPLPWKLPRFRGSFHELPRKNKQCTWPVCFMFRHAFGDVKSLLLATPWCSARWPIGPLSGDGAAHPAVLAFECIGIGREGVRLSVKVGGAVGSKGSEGYI